MADVLTGSVGRSAANRQEDVRLIQRLLNDARAALKLELLKIDGLAGPKTVAAIEDYQRRNALTADGRVDPPGPAFRSLVEKHLASLAAGVVGMDVDTTAIADLSLDDDTFRSAANDYLGRLRT